MRAPDFWQRDGARAQLLRPAGWLFGAAGLLRRAVARPWRAPVPVICVGNIVAGGAGKTPVALSIAAVLAEQGRVAHFLTRGFGGRIAGPVRVDPFLHDAKAVGDEALLLTAIAPTWVVRDRAAGARAACAAGAEALVMDDGLQNPGLAKDLSLIVIDGRYGFGNGRLIPAGPLRETLDNAIPRVQAAVIVGDDRTGVEVTLDGRLPVLRARIVPAPSAENLAGLPVVAFAGIGRPEKFFDTLRDMGCRLVGAHGFPDHHMFAAHEIAAIVEEAAAAGAEPVTTTKDATRLAPDTRALVQVLEVAIAWEDPDALARLLDRAFTTRQPADG